MSGAMRGSGAEPERPRVAAQRFPAERSAVPAGFGRERYYADYDGYRAHGGHGSHGGHAAHGARRSRLPLYAFGAVALVATALTGYVISHRDSGSGAGSGPIIGQTVEGTVSSQQNDATPSSKTVGAIHAAPPTAPAHRDPVSPRAAPALAAVAPGAIQNAAVDAHAAAGKAAAQNGGTATRGDVARNLATARTSLDKNRLWPARRAIMSALAVQPGNADAQQMKADLLAREQERDALLGYGRLCAREGKWSCAWQNAGHAVTIDASSQEAKRLLARAIAAQGAGTAGHIDAGSPGPDDGQ
ncbi:hypothetical protein FHX57_004664 [Paraburkholderia tropica]|uniref:hypothetical protein n=1 Tax=Paraburkholderia tropica TaxID=92647 RepID=UPI00160E9AC3|nr:hypothetical protein [Paraburkholderia tropica]MBB3002297.1 hypothetical protein [Paraburkholderia tropica]MBB6321685.1 hypothetical protein [Paraburkholderia tropica]